VPLRGLKGRIKAGQQVVLGVRPQDLPLAPEAGQGSTAGRVWVVELVGSEKLVEVELGAKRRLTVQVRADLGIREDEPVHVHINPDRVHIFDAETGVRVSPG
jgi:ABC-type sugar transport system ATPase subunit